MAGKASWILTKKVLRGTFIMERWVFHKGQEAFPPFLGFQILFIVCVTKHKYLHHEISKNVPNIQVHCGQQ